MDKQQEPRLRFKGFSGAWEDRILGKVADVRDGTHDSPIYQNQGIPLVTSKNLTENGLDFSNVSLISQEDYEEINKRSKVESGDILLGLIGTIGKPVLVKSGGYAIKNVGLIKELLEVKNEFLLPLLQSNIFETYVSRKNTGNTQKFLALDGLRSFEFLAPKFPEQTYLGLFFRRLDSQIAESRAVLEKSRQLKKAMLAKMFPVNGEKIPKIRFKGFEGEWESRKLGEIGSTFGGLTNKSREDFGHGDARYITYMNVYQNALSSEHQLDSIEIDVKQNEVKKGDVLFTTSSETPEEVGMSSVWTFDINNVYLNSFCFGYRLNKQIDLNYLAYCLRSDYIRSQMILLAQGISRYNISKKGVMEIEILIPTSEEQTAIGNFFRQLDETIALQTAEVEKLNQLKKGLLTAMLV